MPMTSNRRTIIEMIMTAKLDIVTPGEMPREEFLEPLGISAYRLAKDIGVSQNRIRAILHARRAISLARAVTVRSKPSSIRSSRWRPEIPHEYLVESA